MASVTRKGHKVRVCKIPVVVGFFFGAHRESGAIGGIEAAGLLNDGFAVLQHFDHAFGFQFDGAFYIADGIEVLHFHLGAKFGIAFLTNGYVGIAAHAAFFHISIADTEIAKQFAQLR